MSKVIRNWALFEPGNVCPSVIFDPLSIFTYKMKKKLDRIPVIAGLEAKTSFRVLTHSHTMTPFDAPGKQAF